MPTKEIYERLTDIFRDIFDDDALIVRPDLTADAVDGWDSLSHIRLLLTIEKAFKIKFSAAEIGKLRNVGELVAIIAGKTSLVAK
jgi:acyl carrier protein